MRTAELLIRVPEWFGSAFVRAYRLSRPVLGFGVTAAAVVVAGTLYTSSPFVPIPPTEARIVFLTVAGLLGTMIVLALSLAVIPLQRAVEVSTSMALRLYRDDRVARRVLTVLSLMAVASLSFSLLQLPKSLQKLLLALQIVQVGVSFDLMRLHFRQVARLLDISTAATDSLNESVRLILRLRNLVARRARLMMAAGIGRERGRNRQVANYEVVLYAAQKPFHQMLVNTLGHLGGTARRAVAAGDDNGAFAALRSIEGICMTYLDARQSNLMLRLAMLDAFDSDADVVLSPAYEELSRTATVSTAARLEPVVAEVLRSFGRIAFRTLSLSIPAASPNSAPLLWNPLGRLRLAAARAQEAGLEDAALTAARTFSRICQNMPTNLGVSEVCTPIFASIGDIVLLAVSKRSAAVANEASKEVLACVASLIDRGYFDLTMASRLAFEVIGQGSALAIGLRLDRVPLDMSPIGGAAYNLMSPVSLPNLVLRLTRLVDDEPSRAGVSRYGKFLAFNQEVSGHLRALSEAPQLSGGSILTYALLSLKEILRVHIRLITSAELAPAEMAAIEEQVVRYMALCWSTFRHSVEFVRRAADDSADLLAWTALICWTSDRIRNSALSSIRAIAEAACERGAVGDYQLADILMNIEYFGHLATVRGDQAIAAVVAEKLTQPSSCSAELWAATVSALEFRRRQLNDRLLEGGRDRLLDRAEDVLVEQLEAWHASERQRRQPPPEDPADR